MFGIVVSVTVSMIKTDRKKIIDVKIEYCGEWY